MDVEMDFDTVSSLGKLQLSEESTMKINCGIAYEIDESLSLTGKEKVEEDEGIAQDTPSNSNHGEIEQSDTISFNPPVYLQRYATVVDVLSKLLKDPKYADVVNGNTIMEVGCAEFGMNVFFKSILEITKVIFLDLDEQLLTQRKHYLRPLPAEHLQKITRAKPLVVEAYAGCITKVDSKILQETPKVSAIVAIELIEHLLPEILTGFEISVFGVISPSIVIVTTPNADFNTVFNLSPGQFRHWDHKFEWTRAEFITWCERICWLFPDYKYSTSGICSGPLPQTEHLGCVSQMAVFEKIDRNGFSQQEKKPIVHPNVVQDNVYKLIESVEYPNYVETRSPDEIILQEFLYTLTTYWLNRRNIETYMEEQRTELFFPLQTLQQGFKMPTVVQDMEYLRNLFASANYDVRVNEKGEYGIRIVIDEWEKEENNSEFDEDMDDEATDEGINNSGESESTRNEFWDD